MSRRPPTTMTIHADIGEDDLIELQVAFDVQPAERATRDYPGCPASIDICSVKRDGREILSDLDRDQIDEIEDRLWAALDEQSASDRADAAYDRYMARRFA